MMTKEEDSEGSPLNLTPREAATRLEKKGLYTPEQLKKLFGSYYKPTPISNTPNPILYQLKGEQKKSDKEETSKVQQEAQREIVQAMKTYILQNPVIQEKFKTPKTITADDLKDRISLKTEKFIMHFEAYQRECGNFDCLKELESAIIDDDNQYGFDKITKMTEIVKSDLPAYQELVKKFKRENETEPQFKQYILTAISPYVMNHQSQTVSRENFDLLRQVQEIVQAQEKEKFKQNL